MWLRETKHNSVESNILKYYDWRNVLLGKEKVKRGVLWGDLGICCGVVWPDVDAMKRNVCSCICLYEFPFILYDLYEMSCILYNM